MDRDCNTTLAIEAAFKAERFKKTKRHALITCQMVTAVIPCLSLSNHQWLWGMIGCISKREEKKKLNWSITHRCTLQNSLSM
jgi:hypothetical protein